MKTVPEYFGSLVFDDRVMKSVLSDKVYKSLKKTIDEDARLDVDVAKARISLTMRLDENTDAFTGRPEAAKAAFAKADAARNERRRANSDGKNNNSGRKNGNNNNRNKNDGKNRNRNNGELDLSRLSKFFK